MLDNSAFSALWGLLMSMYSWATSHNAVDCTIDGTHYTLSWFAAIVSLFVCAIIADVALYFVQRGTASGGDDA